jgi:Protein of unknown function, DUF547
VREGAARAVLVAAASLGVASSLATPASAGAFDHSTFDALLRKHVALGLVDYDGFKGPDFKAYLASLDKADPAALDDKERLAWWINAYNAYTIELINKHKERDSIRNINKSLGIIKGYGPWKEQLVKAGGKVYHLDNVEHDIIRKQWNEPRIHFALVCAAMGCPPLRSEAYTGIRLEDQLQDQAVEFLVRSPAKNRVDVATGTVHGSPIYVKYYPEDFGGAKDKDWTPATLAALGKYLASFHPAGATRQLLLSGTFKLVETEYDWTLNSQAKAKELAAKRK